MSLSDSTLITQFISGNNQSFSILVDRYQKRVYGFIFSKVKDAELADDVFQDTFVKVIKNLRLSKYKDEGRFLSWVMRIAHNIIMDHFRKVNRLPKHESKHEDLDVLDRLIEQSNSIEDLMIETQIHADLSILINELYMSLNPFLCSDDMYMISSNPILIASLSEKILFLTSNLFTR